VYSGSATARTADTRTNTETSFTIFNADVVLSLLRDRISAATGAPTAHFEITKLLHYEPGEHFALHADFLEPNTPELIQEIQVRGQRAATLLVYLNDDYDGGETEFPRLQLRFKGRRGDALLFSNVDAAGAADYDTVHAGLPPTRGEKWLLSQWIRTRPL
jgi:prolyl 4-hydroxylase